MVVAGYESDPLSYDYQITECHLDILRKAVDAKRRKLDIITLEAPRTIRQKYVSDNFFASYINYYVCNNAVIMPEFGDEKADRAAAEKLKELYPKRDIVMINIDAIAIAEGGGGSQGPSVQYTCEHRVTQNSHHAVRLLGYARSLKYQRADI